MRLKSYFASTVEEAIALASRELGDDAMLVYSRETVPEARNLGRYEAVFALDAGAPAVTGVPAQAPATEVAVSAGLEAPLHELRSDVIEMKRQLSRMERVMVHAASSAAASRASAAYEEIFEELLAREVPADIAAGVLSSLERAHAPGAAPSRAAVAAELGAQFCAMPCGTDLLGEGRAHAFVGPAGGGKTTMLVKLAVHLGVERRVPVMLVSLDSRRIGGADQLKTFAHILGVPFNAVDHRAALERLIETEGRRHTIFLDTPGLSEEDLTEQAWLPAALRSHADVQTHLVLPAYMRTRECVRLLRRFECFRPASVILTHMDDCEAAGGVAGEVLRRGLPVSYCGTGQAIPEDLQAAEPEWLARQIFPLMEEAAGGGARGAASWAVA